jgi:hypothetical protein
MEGKNISFFSNRILRWLAWSLVGLIVILMGIGLALQVITDSPFGGGPFVIQFSEALALSGFAIIGALIVSRQPRHPIGWIWILIAISFGRDHFVWGYAYYGYIAKPGSLPGTEAAIVLLYFLGRGSSGMLGLTLLLLLFPTGRLLSRRWSPVAWIAIGAAAISIPVFILAPAPIIYFPFPTDLLAIGDSTQNVVGQASSILVLLSLLCFMAAALSLFLRLVRSRGVERQQLKWFVSAAALMPVAFIFIFSSGSRQEPRFCHRHPALPFVRYRHHHPSLIGLWCPDLVAGVVLFRERGVAAAGFPSPHRGRLTGGYCDLHAGNCCLILTIAALGAGYHRPALLPSQVQCSTGLGDLLGYRPG